MTTPAREELRAGLLGWRQPRPPAPRALAAELRLELERRIAAVDLAAATARRRDGTLWVTKTRLDRLACDGYQLDAEPFTHSRANARGSLAHKAIEQDWELGRETPAESVVERAWTALASDRPGDPRSLASWLNALGRDDADDLCREVVLLLETFREVWPPLPEVDVRAERKVRLRLGGGRVLLFGVPDLVLRSPRADDRCRTLVVDFKTGRPRAEHDRHELRFYALLATLEEGRPPFRWATFYVTEGRAEWEDLGEEALWATVARIGDAVVQAERIGPGDDESRLRLQAGAWCRFCAREDDCEVAAEAVSQGPGMLRP